MSALSHLPLGSEGNVCFGLPSSTWPFWKKHPLFFPSFRETSNCNGLLAYLHLPCLLPLDSLHLFPPTLSMGGHGKCWCTVEDNNSELEQSLNEKRKERMSWKHGVTNYSPCPSFVVSWANKIIKFPFLLRKLKLSLFQFQPKESWQIKF